MRITNIVSLSILKLELLLLASSISITLYLAFIDEGNYSFEWIYDGGSWVALLLYTLVIYGTQFLLFGLILKRIPIVGKILSIVVVLAAITSMIYLGIIM